MALRTEDHVQNAADHHTNLSMFYAIIALCESGSFYGSSPHSAINRIVQTCQKAGAKELRLMDAAIAKAERSRP